MSALLWFYGVIPSVRVCPVFSLLKKGTEIMSAATKSTKQTTVKSKKKSSTERLVVTAVLIGLATALSMITLYKLPMGGSITLLSMLPIIIISVKYGVGWGLTGAFAYSLIQLGLDIGNGLFAWGLSPIGIVGSIFLDDIIAYTVLGFSGMFRKKGVPGICAGVFITVFVKFICHFVSGGLIFGSFAPDIFSNGWIYSLAYNGSYMLPELIFTMIGSVILFKTPQFAKLVENKTEN